MTLEQKMRVLRDVAEGVHAAHRTGLIHRDLKPANVLVERTEEGVFRPYVLDFGLARETAGAGMTRTGMVLGTLDYMAPEQLCGAGIDRRADVWALGTTAYELLAGERPFEADNDAALVLRILNEDPVPLRKRVRSIPADLDTVVMRCLERDPARRYGSARELAEDLDRWLDGEPVLARPASRTYRLLKRVRKNRTLAAVLAVSVAAVAVLGTVALRAQWRAAETALAAQRFGQQVEEIESRLRIAFLLPLHDVRRDRRQVRERMRAIARQMEEIGDLAAGPGHYALGRGHLALDELAAAQRDLEAAWRLGYRPPEVAWTLGRVLAGRYQRGLEDANRIAEASLRDAHRKAVARDFLAPARRYLRSVHGRGKESAGGGGAVAASPSYVEALLAYAEERRPAALVLAAQALREDPSVYEAALLQGEVQTELASADRRVGRYDDALRRLDEARRAYAEAARIARSDPQVYAAICTREVHAFDLGMARDTPLAPLLPAALAVCDRALAVDPESARVLTEQAKLHLWVAQQDRRRGEEILERLEAAISLARRALAADPVYAMAHDRLGMAQMYLGQRAAGRGEDPRPTYRQALASLRKAVDLQPGFALSWQPLGYAHLSFGEYEMTQGIDPLPSFRRAVDAYRRGLAIDGSLAILHHHLAYTRYHMSRWGVERGQDPRPVLRESIAGYQRALAIDAGAAPAWLNLGNAHAVQGQYELTHGIDPRPTLAAATASYTRALEVQPGYGPPQENRGAVLVMQAEYELQTGLDPLPILARAREDVQASLSFNPNDPFVHANLATIEHNRALALLGRKLDPTEAVAEGRRASDRSLALNPNDGEVLASRADLALVAARWARTRGRSPAPDLAAADRDLARALDINSQDPKTWIILAGAEQIRAEDALARGANADAANTAIAKGLNAARRALAINPKNAEAELQRGAHLLLAARASRDPAVQQKKTEEARRALARAVELDPLQKREVEALLSK